jgi:phosphotransferase system enzyme I (PtsI)
MTLAIKGIAVSRGIAMGRAHKLERGQPEVAETCIPRARLDDEIDRLRRAIDVASKQLKQIREKIPVSTPTDIAGFIDTHLLMLNDSALSEAPVQIIRSHLCSAEWALKLQLDTLVSVFDEMDDAYLKTRRDDVIHVVNRILRILTNMDEELPLHEGTLLLHNRIVVADDLTPADIVLLQHQGMIAFVTESGGPLSHTAILARSLKLPAIVGIHHAKRYLLNDEDIIIDGDQGIVLARTSNVINEYYEEKQRAFRQYYSSLQQLRNKPAVSLDNITVHLLANAEVPEDMQALHDTNVDGIGLFRSEYLFMNRDDLPDEEEQFNAYRKIVSAMNGKPVTIRTLDLGADKPLKNLQQTECPTNPALGLRAIRLCLRDPGLFRPQLRAILRASAYGPVRMMIPMLSNTQEIFQVLTIMDNIKAELSSQGIEFDINLPVGGMIEVPAAAISSHLFARHLDFLSIGTNDLIQYTLAIDRIDEDVNYLYKPSHPSVLILIHQIIEAGRNADIPVTMCGEMAGDPDYTRLLLGLGLREFSMQPNAILEVKNIINHSLIRKLVSASHEVLQCEHAEDALQHIQAINTQQH